MTRDFALVDTNIWRFALAKPKEKEFAELNEKAQRFLSSLVNDQTVRIGLSSYQVCEILEVLRKTGISREEREKILEDFKKAKFYVKPLTLEDAVKAARDSAKSNIHVCDYLVVYPLRGVLNAIYSADSHLMHEDFTSICEVINPLSPWFQTEGKQPQKLARGRVA